MRIFKEKKERVIKDDDSLFVKLWYNKRTHAMIVLGMYAIFFIILFIIAALNSNTNIEDNIARAEELSPFFTSLNDKDLSFNVVINSADEDMYYFSGSKEGNIVKGNLLHNEDNLLIEVSKDICTVGDSVDGIFLGDINKSCPEIFDYNIFDYEKIYNEISKNTSKIRKYEKYYLVTLEGIQYKIYVKDDTLSRIDILDKDVTYNVKYHVTEQNLSEDAEILNIE